MTSHGLPETRKRCNCAARQKWICATAGYSRPSRDKFPRSIGIVGPRLANERVLRRYAERLKGAVRDCGRAWDVHESWGQLGNQLDVNVLSDQANMSGMTNITVAATLAKAGNMRLMPILMTTLTTVGV